MALGAQLRELVDSFSDLVAQHVRLARLELAQDARFIGVRVGFIALLAPLFLVGWGFLCVALALAIHRSLSADVAFLIVGLLNLVLGGVGIGFAAKSLAGHKVMDASLHELESSTSIIRKEKR
jgi:uncharacterized membrane protein YqjE